VSGKCADQRPRALWLFLGWTAVAATSFAADAWLPWAIPELPSELSVVRLTGLLASIMAGAEAAALATALLLARRHKPPVEGAMVRRIWLLLGILAGAVMLIYGMGQIRAIGTAFAMFGGMLLGWSLQAPVSGFAAWLLISLKRPFRPGDRVQFPNLGLTGDVKDIGPMYTVLDQVGGSVGSEEAVGRYILVPNAMLFSQVVINYTVLQEAPYMLDEVVVRITYDSDWDAAERILMDAAREETGDIIQATGQQPYIRSDFWEYGILMRLRFHTRVKDRAEIAYRISRSVFREVQRAPRVDLAIPFIYSNRAGMDLKESDASGVGAGRIEEIPLDRIVSTQPEPPAQDVEVVAKSICAQGLLQPVVVVKRPEGGLYELLAGHVRFEACRKLGWKVIPAVVRGTR
jgi:small-conductance mechanosensitive channel